MKARIQISIKRYANGYHLLNVNGFAKVFQARVPYHVFEKEKKNENLINKTHFFPAEIKTITKHLA